MIENEISNLKSLRDSFEQPDAAASVLAENGQAASDHSLQGVVDKGVRILCLSSSFPPHGGSEAFCAGKMALALKENGADVSAFYMDDPQYASHYDTSSCWRTLGPDSFPVPHCANRDRSRAAFFALKYHTVAWPRWVSDVVNSATQLHHRTPFNIVYSRCPSLCNQIAGYWLSRNLKLPWIVNINDPWDYHLFPDAPLKSVSPLQARMSNFWLRRTLVSADLVTYPCRRLADFTARLAGFEPRTEIIPHIGRLAATSLENNGFRLVHAGKLGSNEITGRTTRALLIGLKRFLDSEPTAIRATNLLLVGAEDPNTNATSDKLGLKSNVTNVGQVTYEKSLEYIASASACLLIEGNMREGVYLPSKLADYLIARKPVLALSPAVGTISDMSGDPAVIRVERNDEEGIERAIKKLYDLHRSNTVPSLAPSDGLVSQFSAETISRQFLSLAAEMVARS